MTIEAKQARIELMLEFLAWIEQASREQREAREEVEDLIRTTRNALEDDQQ